MISALIAAFTPFPVLYRPCAAQCRWCSSIRSRKQCSISIVPSALGRSRKMPRLTTRAGRRLDEIRSFFDALAEDYTKAMGMPAGCCDTG